MGCELARDAVIRLHNKNPAQYYETYYTALNSYYRSQGMSESAAHAMANKNLAASKNDGGLGYMVYSVPDGQSVIGTNGKLNPNATLGNRVVYNGQDYLLTPDDWEDIAFRSSMRQEYNVSVSGATGSQYVLRLVRLPPNNEGRYHRKTRIWNAAPPV